MNAKFMVKLTRARLATILGSIPSFDEKAIPMWNLVSALGNDGTNEDRYYLLYGVLYSLQVFNVVLVSRSGKVKASSEVSTYFLRSYCRYIKKNLYLVSSWERPGLDQQIDMHTMMNWGSNFLYLMEHKRVRQFGDIEPIRFIDVVQLIIKARVQGEKEPMYLTQYDTQAHILQFIGGKRKKTDKSYLDTIVRSLVKELPMNQLIYKQNYELAPVIEKMSHETLSPTYGAYSRYSFDVYQLFSQIPFLKLGPLDKWVTLSEINNRVTTDGLAISDIDYAQGDMDSLPLSLETVQPPHVASFSHIVSSINREDDAGIKKIIAEGESENVEFKSSFHYDYNEKKLNRGLEKPILKTIAAFLNSGGGTLLIGVEDSGKILGLEEDFKLLQKANNDGFSQMIFNAVASALGIEYSSFVQIRFSRIESKSICIVTVKPSLEPVFLREGTNREFFVRGGTTTKLLNSQETFKYIGLHW